MIKANFSVQFKQLSGNAISDPSLLLDKENIGHIPGQLVYFLLFCSCVFQCPKAAHTELFQLQMHLIEYISEFLMLRSTFENKSRENNCPKCSANPITVTPIWKWEFENKEHPIRGLYKTFFEFFFSNFHSHIKDSKWGRKCIFINWRSCNGSPPQIPL